MTTDIVSLTDKQRELLAKCARNEARALNLMADSIGSRLSASAPDHIRKLVQELRDDAAAALEAAEAVIA